MKFPLPSNESARLETLRGYQVLDTTPEEAFDALAKLAAELCQAPIALVSLVDEARAWFKARVGSGIAQLPRDEAFCPHALVSASLLHVPDAARDPRFADLPMVRGEASIRLYAGVPLTAPNGRVLGTLCVLDREPRSLSEFQQKALRVLADQVVAQLELRKLMGEKLHHESALLDLTEDRLASDQALRNSEQEQRKLAVSLEAERALLAEAQAVAKVGSWETDLATGSVRWSAETHHIFETDPVHFHPSHEGFLRIVHPEDRAVVDEAFVTSIDHKKPCVIEHRILMPDGRVKYVEERWQAFADALGNPLRVRGTSQDITDRRVAEGQLRLLENSISQINEMIIITRAAPLDEPGPEILFVNDAFERVTGYKRAEVIGKTPRLLQGEKTSREVLKCIRTALTAGQPVHEEIINYTKSGQEYWVDLTITPVNDAKGRITHLVATQRDVTERKKLEEQFLRAQRMESIGTLAGGIAHDLNNLLSPILMGVDLIRQRDPREDTKMLLDNMQRSGRRAADLVKQVLSFARGVEGVRVSVRLDHIVKEIESIVANTFPKNVTLEVTLPDDLWLVVADPTQLNQVVLNLCVNARDAMPKGGALGIVCHNIEIDAQYAVMNRGVSTGRYVVVEVTDNGTGIPKEILDRIFEPFFTTKPVGSGTGLGLSTVIGIVRSHGGFVNVYSEPGHGSVFKVYLPAQDINAPAVTGMGKYANMPRGDGELVLIVDDESSILSVTKQTLESFGYRTLAAEDGAQAIGLFAKHSAEISVILTDMMMPIMDGAALIAAVRRMNQNVPIISASGLSSNGSVAKAMAAGVKDFLAKPYTTDVLLQMLHKVLMEKAGFRSTKAEGESAAPQKNKPGKDDASPGCFGFTSSSSFPAWRASSPWGSGGAASSFVFLNLGSWP